MILAADPVLYDGWFFAIVAVVALLVVLVLRALKV